MSVCCRWDDLVEASRWQTQYPRVDGRLKPQHLQMDNYRKMNVRTAVDVMLEPIEDIMIEEDAFGTTSKYFQSACGQV